MGAVCQSHALALPAYPNVKRQSRRQRLLSWHMLDHSELKAWALVWPSDPHVLLYKSADRAEEDRVWFSKNFKTDRDGNMRGEPFVIELGRCIE